MRERIFGLYGNIWNFLCLVFKIERATLIRWCDKASLVYKRIRELRMSIYIK